MSGVTCKSKKLSKGTCRKIKALIVKELLNLILGEVVSQAVHVIHGVLSRDSLWGLSIM